MKAFGKYALTFLLVVSLLFVVLIGAASLPDNVVQGRFEESSEYMAGHDTDYLIHKFAMSSQLDHMADCITLSIAYYLHGDSTLRSAMRAYYYGNESDQMNRYLQESVETDIHPNQDYLFYWNGSAAATRILHLFMSIRGIYFFHTVLMAVLVIVLILILWKNRMKGEAIAFVLSMVAVSVWYVPWCLKYTYSFLCMLATAIIGAQLALRGKDQWIGPMFLVTGMVTVYFDFLTTEALSLLVPLLLILRMQCRYKTGKQLWLNALKYGFAWGIGYLGMWVMKWAFASLILHMDVIPYVLGHIAEMMHGRTVGYYVTGNFYTDVLMKNILLVFPLEYGISGAMLIFALVFMMFVLPVALGKVALRKQIKGGSIALYAVIGLIPYVRYLVLSNHSYANFFYTYRAQAATVLALCCIVFELVERISEKGVIKNT